MRNFKRGVAFAMAAVMTVSMTGVISADANEESSTISSWKEEAVITPTATPKVEETTTQVTPTTTVPVETTKATTIGKVKIKSAKATKKKSAKVTWKKAAGTKKYQVQI